MKIKWKVEVNPSVSVNYLMAVLVQVLRCSVQCCAENARSRTTLWCLCSSTGRRNMKTASQIWSKSSSLDWMEQQTQTKTKEAGMLRVHNWFNRYCITESTWFDWYMTLKMCFYQMFCLFWKYVHTNVLKGVLVGWDCQQNFVFLGGEGRSV